MSQANTIELAQLEEHPAILVAQQCTLVLSSLGSCGIEFNSNISTIVFANGSTIDGMVH